MIWFLRDVYSFTVVEISHRNLFPWADFYDLKTKGIPTLKSDSDAVMVESAHQ